MTGSLTSSVQLDASRRRVVIIAARFNATLVDQLIDGATAAWREHGGDPARLLVERVPGAFELPLAAKMFAASGAVEAVIKSALRTHARVVHVGVHTFTPTLNGKKRTADVGLLFDPARKAEVDFCEVWLHALHWEAPLLRVKKNYPYKGTSDGLTTALREKFAASRYVGIELEVNQALAAGPARRFTDIPNRIARSLALLIIKPED